MKKGSLGNKLICLFCITSIIPILVLSFFSYYSSKNTINKNTQKLGDIHVKQIDDNLNILLESYEAVLYQIYTEDSMVEWAEQLDAGKEEAVTVSQMRRFFSGILNSREYIRSITVIMGDGTIVSYDQITPKTYENSWMKQYSLSAGEFYNEVISDSGTHLYPPEYATTFANQDNYLFHMAHRIIDYRDLEKECGIVILSLDVSLLQQACQSDNEDETTFNFIVDNDGRIIFYDDFSLIGTQLDGEEQAEKKYLELLRNNRDLAEKNILLSVYEDEALGWNIIGVTNQEEILKEIKNRLGIVVVISLLLFSIAIAGMFSISGQLVRSVQSVVRTMKKMEGGDMENRVEVNKRMPAEIKEIAIAFNSMLEKLEISIEKEKRAIDLQKDAEIKALEAQINPHFLYNTLDTINWLAIEEDAFNISNAISSLGYILRYAISNSNREVLLTEELDWLKKYIYLQQFRLKEQFVCNISVEDDVKVCKVHKLLLQPFIENVILHGFRDNKEKHILSISIEKDGNFVKVMIEDNGIGIPDNVLKEFQEYRKNTEKEKYHIGMRNAMMRLEMYYGNAADVHVESKENIGTKIRIVFPFIT